MSTTTTKYGLTKPDDADPLVEVVSTQLRATMDRLDLLLGESGSQAIQATAADTNVSVRVNYSRDYTSTGKTPRVALTCDSQTGSTVTQHAWVTAEDYTGFTLNMRKSNTTISSWRWFARPLG